MKHERCKVADIPAEGGVLVPFFGGEPHVCGSGDRIRAAANVSLHFGGPLECREGRFVCPWHNAAFDMATGDRLEGSAPKDPRLMFLSMCVEGDALNYAWGE